MLSHLAREKGFVGLPHTAEVEVAAAGLVGGKGGT
jgi:hypothetical protein